MRFGTPRITVVKQTESVIRHQKWEFARQAKSGGGPHISLKFNYILATSSLQHFKGFIRHEGFDIKLTFHMGSAI